MEEGPEELYAAALTLTEQSQPSEALAVALKLWKQVQHGTGSQKLPAVNLLGEISVELGDVPNALNYFKQAVLLDPEGQIPETLGGGAEKFLWIAQLCDEGGRESMRWFEKGIAALQHEITSLENGNVAGIRDEVVTMMKVDKKRKLASALCGMIEIYMTDLSWDEEAESRCESLITTAIAVEDDPSAEVLQTLASVRLSQQRLEDAQSALARSLGIWKDLDPEDVAVPDFASRISLSRILMEAEMELDAMSVLKRLVLEDDESIEAWYLGGWCQRLLADHNPVTGEQIESLSEPRIRTMQASRNWLKTALRLYEQFDCDDEKLLEHSQEIVAELDDILGPMDSDEDGEAAEWNGIEDDSPSEEHEDGDNDQIMADS